MSSRKLSPDVISLIHHVHLNEAGWWRKAVAQIVLAVFWAQRTPISLSEAAKEFERLVGIALSERELRSHTDALKAQGALIESLGKVKLSERVRAEMNTAHESATRQQSECEQTFIALCKLRCPDVDATATWHAFSKALAHAVSVAGANLVHLLADGRLLREIDWPALLFSKFPQESRQGLRVVLAEFLGEATDACRSVILRHLSAHFFAEASLLRPETIEAVERGRKRRIIKVVLDTNFIFSVLGLHDNPGDDSANSLLNLAKTENRHLDIRLYVLPGTLDEAKRTLVYQQASIERVSARPNLAKAALSQPLSSIARKFFDTAIQAQGLSAEAYFQPYITDLRMILQDKGINVLDVNQLYHTRQDVVDDTLAEQERENSEVIESRRKGYEKILHDVVLWHAVKDRRLGDTNSPFDVEYWGVTIDWALIGFDRKKRHSGASTLPVVLHPSNLLQLVQFWIPRTPELEDGLIDTLRLPLLFQSFDHQDEKATIKVLEAISRFENVDDIPESTLRVVLASQALRSKLRSEVASNDEVFELVRDELLAEHREVVSRLSAVNDSLDTTERKLKEGQDALALAEQELIEVRRSRDEVMQQVAEVSRLERERRDRTEILEAELASRVKIGFIWTFIVVPLLLGIALASSCFVMIPGEGRGRMLWVIATGLLPLAVAFSFAHAYVAKRATLSEWRMARVIGIVGKRFVILPALTAAAAIWQGVVWDSVKAATGFGQSIGLEQPRDPKSAKNAATEEKSEKDSTKRGPE